jgi:REP element-mobilizing transposase RayT
MYHPETVAFWRGRLPHWEVVDGRYFITLRLWGTLPGQAVSHIRHVAQQIRDCRQENYVKLERRIFGLMERWLDDAPERRDFDNAELADMILEAIAHREKQGIWTVFEHVVMPGHVHMYLKFDQGRLKETMEGFKRWTGHRAADLLDYDHKRFWQREWFDHWARSPEEGDAIMAYIRQNPVKAHLVNDYREWPHGSWQ